MTMNDADLARRVLELRGELLDRDGVERANPPALDARAWELLADLPRPWNVEITPGFVMLTLGVPEPRFDEQHDNTPAGIEYALGVAVARAWVAWKEGGK